MRYTYRLARTLVTASGSSGGPLAGQQCGGAAHHPPVLRRLALHQRYPPPALQRLERFNHIQTVRASAKAASYAASNTARYSRSSAARMPCGAATGQ